MEMPEVPSNLKAAIDKALENDPEEASEALAEIRKVSQGNTSTACTHPV